eukprot:GHVP01060873.1.p1 GENE.GHVP01060873.1~~GHVP01060873.1.p1  ORF type:complete len:364 (-),score=54.35 GHVP01060873.1:1464-2555(-)
MIRSRSPIECAERFAAEISDEDSGSDFSDSDSDSGSSSGSELEASNPIATNEGSTEANFEMSDEISIVELELQGVAYFFISCLRVQVTCYRCKSLQEFIMTYPNKDLEAFAPKLIGSGKICSKCSSKISFYFSPVLSFTGSHSVGKFIAGSCQLSIVNPSDFVLTCAECQAPVKTREVSYGTLRPCQCYKCFQKMSVKLGGFDFRGEKVKVSNIPGMPVKIKKKKIPADNVKLTIGTPLPKFGACKHYKKSFKWFRFPCCNMIFPCETCHDAEARHDCVWATRIICGYCSKEQSSNTKLCSCGHSMTGVKTAHWQGGKGCRDPTKMSTKDSKKYKLLSKQKEKQDKQKAEELAKQRKKQNKAK